MALPEKVIIWFLEKSGFVKSLIAIITVFSFWLFWPITWLHVGDLSYSLAATRHSYYGWFFIPWALACSFLVLETAEPHYKSWRKWTIIRRHLQSLTKSEKKILQKFVDDNTTVREIQYPDALIETYFLISEKVIWPTRPATLSGIRYEIDKHTLSYLTKHGELLR